MKSAVTVIIVFLSCALAGAQGTPDVARDSAKGTGFVVKLPADVEVDVAPTAELAFGINLDAPSRNYETHGREWTRVPLRSIGFSTRWDAGDSLDNVVKNMTEDVASLVPHEITGDGVVKIVATLPARLGELPARRLVIEFANSKHKPAIRQMVVAFRSRADGSPLVYVATLTTTRADFDHDLSLFGKLLAGFKLTAVE